jgi:hypothetical protein
LRGWKKAKEAQRTQELSFVGEAQLQAKAPGYARCCVRFQYIGKESVQKILRIIGQHHRQGNRKIGVPDAEHFAPGM